MISDISELLLLAQEGGDQGGGGNSFFLLWFPLILILAMWWFIIFRPQRQEQQRREALLNSLKKNDRIVTIGGIIGTVANLSPDDKEVTVKIDDNTRIRMLRSSIQNVLKDEEEEGTENKS